MTCFYIAFNNKFYPCLSFKDIPFKNSIFQEYLGFTLDVKLKFVEHIKNSDMVRHEVRVASYELRVKSCEFKATSYEFESMSYELESTSSKIIKSLNH